jgi:hypothetical protein
MREMSTSFRLTQKLGDLTVYLSGWSHHRLQPTFSADENDGLIWIDDAKFDRWKAKHREFGPSEWADVPLEKVFMPEPRASAGRRRYLRDNRNRSRVGAA